MKLVELRELCEACGLSTTGKKAALVGRFLSASTELSPKQLGIVPIRQPSLAPTLALKDAGAADAAQEIFGASTTAVALKPENDVTHRVAGSQLILQGHTVNEHIISTKVTLKDSPITVAKGLMDHCTSAMFKLKQKPDHAFYGLLFGQLAPVAKRYHYF